jgi:hypothetical protein
LCDKVNITGKNGTRERNVDALGYTEDQLHDAATDYVLADQTGRLDEASRRAAQGEETFGLAEWDAMVDRVRATSWVGMPGYVGGQS